MLKLFLQIWNEREHVSQLSGKPLFYPNHLKWHWQFAHILGKNVAPKWKMNKENIILVTPKEHEKQEEHPAFLELQLEMKSKYFKQFGIKKTI